MSKGFTLIEMMVVLVILTILLTIALPSYQNYVKKAKVREAQSNLIALSLSIESNYQRQLSFIISDLETTKEVESVFNSWHPTTDSFIYKYYSNGETYTIEALGKDEIIANCELSLNEISERSIKNCGLIESWIN